MPQLSCSIIISVRNCFSETKQCLDSLLNHFDDSIGEVILVDDASDEETAKFLIEFTSHSKFKLIRNNQNLGFGISNNRAAYCAECTHLLFLNNDTILSNGWLEPIVEGFSENSELKNVGCLGNVQDDPRKKAVDHAGVIFNNGIPEHDSLGVRKFERVGYSEFLAVTGACFMIRKELFLSVGGFDEEYRTGFEDIDLCLKLKMLGFNHYVSNESRILHKKSSTSGRNKYQGWNSNVFYNRWRKLITRFQEWDLTQGLIRENGNEDILSVNQKFVCERGRYFLFADSQILLFWLRKFEKENSVSNVVKIRKLITEVCNGSIESIEATGVEHLIKEEFDKAEILFEQCIASPLEDPRYLELLAECKKRAGDIVQAQKIYHKAIKLFPFYLNSFHGLAECKILKDKVPEAINVLKKSQLIEPDNKLTWIKLANCYSEMSQWTNAVFCFEKGLQEKNVDKTWLYENAFRAFCESSNFQKAWAFYQQYSDYLLSPDSILRVANITYHLGLLSRAEVYLNIYLELNGGDIEAHSLMGNIKVGLRQFKEAVRQYDLYLQLNPHSSSNFSNMVNSKSFLCQWGNWDLETEKVQLDYRKGLLIPNPFDVVGLNLVEEDECRLGELKSNIEVKKVDKLKKQLAFQYTSVTRERKRLGFISSDLRGHAVGHLIARLLECLNRNRYEIYIYSTSPKDGNQVQRRIHAVADKNRYLYGCSTKRKARIIHQDKLDMLIDLGGFSIGNNVETLALRPAPRQVHFLGYASSMGIGLVDYIIADKKVLPASSSKLYAEKIVYMNGCFFPPGDFSNFAPRGMRKNFGLPSRGIVYCAFHAAYKLEPIIWSCWMRILKAVPESVLWLKFKPAEDAIKNLRSEAVRQGVSSKRIIMAEDMPDRSAHLSRMTVADLYLDCPLYNGHASAMDALHAKLPILTIKGNRFCNRVGESFLKHLGLPELVARDLQQYERTAIKLGLRPSKLLPLRKQIQENADAVLSPPDHAKRFEFAVEQILKKPLPVPIFKKQPSLLAAKKLESKKSLQDLTLILIRPSGITNWAENVNRLASEWQKKSGSVIVIEGEGSSVGRSDFKTPIIRLKTKEVTPANALNHALINIRTNYALILDDPLRAMPAPFLVQFGVEVMKAFIRDNIGYLGVGSKMEPHTGCLVSKLLDTKKQKKLNAGFSSPCFGINLKSLSQTGGFRSFGNSLALSCLDLSLRLESSGYKSVLLETDKILCPAHSGQDYLNAAGRNAIDQFVKNWKRTPVSLKPKYAPMLQQVGETPDYQEWIRLCDTIHDYDLLKFRAEAEKLAYKPLISVIMPVFDTPKLFLEKAIESVLAQTYENWELCIADDASSKKYIRPLLERCARMDSRIKVTFRKTNGHISEASNTALKLAKGEFVAFFDHDDELRPHSLLEVAKSINKNPDVNLIYSDEDKIDEQGNRYNPYFKPDWNPDLLLGQNYLCHLSIFRTSLVKDFKGLRKGFEGGQDWDLILRLTEGIDHQSITHIPKVLYHWRSIKGSTASGVDQKLNIFNSTRKVLEETCHRRNLKTTISFPDKRWNYPRLKFSVDKSAPKVTILIPSQDRIDLLEKCISSIISTISYDKYDIIIIDNNSREKRSIDYLKKIQNDRRVSVLKADGEFNYSKLNNFGVAKASGDILLLLNNDIEATQDGWFEEMLSHVLRPNIGCVGAKLLYPSRTLQHGGVIVGLGGCAGHSHKHAGRDSLGYSGHLSVVRNSSAVTAACLMIRKGIYLESGGFDEASLKVAFNDVDFCLRVQKIGYRNLWTPFAELIHHESASRGSDSQSKQKKKRSFQETRVLSNRWSLTNYNDPYYNPNLTNSSEQYWYGIFEERVHQVRGGSLPALPNEKVYDLGQSICCHTDQNSVNNTIISDNKNQRTKNIFNEERPSAANKLFLLKKTNKREILSSILKQGLHFEWKEFYFDCMPKNAFAVHGIKETENVSAHEYDSHAVKIIKSYTDGGIILDCGSGQRPTYYSNVVNFDPVAYQSTDVVGVGEELPFKDNSFDAVFSLNVLEHVRDPFRCAKEIARVLKPSGSLYCVVPFMSPYHGYPDHYYNMTQFGLSNLFKDYFNIEKQDVLDSGHPIHSITWILRSWSEGLLGNVKDKFLEKRVGELIGDPNGYFGEPFVDELTLKKKFELGATTALWAKKKVSRQGLIKNGALRLHGTELKRTQYKETWNNLSADFDSARNHVTGDADEPALKKSAIETISRIDSYVKFNKMEVVLEIGCGIGRVGKELASRCKKWIGCDISTNMLGHAKKRLSHLKNIELIELHESNLSPIADDSVDVVYCTVVFMHLDEWDRYEYVKEAYRVLRGGGRAYFDNFSLTTEKGWRIFKAHYELHERPSHISKSSTPEELCQYMERSKFIEVETQLDDLWVIVSGFKKTDSVNSFRDFSLLKLKPSSKIISLHVPKTGGTSFGDTLQVIYGDSYLAHYPKLINQGFEDLNIFIDKKCIHGHLMLDHYEQILEQSDLITWLRCPVDRTISLYHHIFKHPDPENDFHQRVLKEKPTLLEFCEMQINHNQLFHMIGNRKPEAFKFIGFLETAESSIVKCATALSWSHVPKFPWYNKTSSTQKIKLLKKEIEHIKSKNLEEICWIKSAQKLFS